MRETSKEARQKTRAIFDRYHSVSDGDLREAAVLAKIGEWILPRYCRWVKLDDGLWRRRQ